MPLPGAFQEHSPHAIFDQGQWRRRGRRIERGVRIRGRLQLRTDLIPYLGEAPRQRSPGIDGAHPCQGLHLVAECVQIVVQEEAEGRQAGRGQRPASSRWPRRLAPGPVPRQPVCTIVTSPPTTTPQRPALPDRPSAAERDRRELAQRPLDFTGVLPVRTRSVDRSNTCRLSSILCRPAS